MRNRRFIIALALLCAFAPWPAHAQFTKSTLSSQVDQQFPDNNTGAITPSIFRSWMKGSLIPSFQQFTGVNPQAGTSYTVQLSDYGQLVTFNNALPVAVTLPQAILPFSPFNFYAKNVGTGLVTITPQGGSTINGAATLTVPAGTGFLVVSDGTNYQIATFSLPSIANTHILANTSGGNAIPVDTAGTTWFDSAYCSTVGWLIARTTGGWVCAQGVPANVEWFNVLPGNSAATNSTNLTSLISTIQSAGGGWLFFPGKGYNFNTSFAISKPMKISCAYRADPTVDGNLRQTASSSIFLIRSGYVTFTNCSTNGGSTPIAIGDDALSVTNGAAVNNGNTTLTCAGCSFTSADIGKQLSVQTQGFLTTISGVTDGTHVVLALAPGFSNAAITFAYGFNYQEVVIADVAIFNYTGFGVSIVNATQYHLRHVYSIGPDALSINNLVWGDEGDGSITESTFIGTVAGSHNTVIYSGGGALRFENNKVLAQAAISACFSIQWSGIQSIGPFFVGNSVEGSCTHGFELASSASGAILHGGIISGNHLSAAAGNSALFLNPTNAVHPSWSISGNLFRATGASSAAVTINNMTVVSVADNSIENTDGAGGGTAYSINNTTTGVVRIGSSGFANSMNTAAAFSAGLIVDNQVGMTFANLPTAISNGSRIFVSDGAPASSPCTGASTGSAAFRQNSAWKCF